MFTALALSSAISVGLYAFGLLFYHAGEFWFLNWNLLLAWLPVLFMLLLNRYLDSNRWITWQGIFISALWLAFLPNTFYLISDLVHLNYITTTNLLYFVVLLFSFSFNGLILGYISLYMFHEQLRKRVSRRMATGWVVTILLLCSFAIYLGRYLRWSTWDIVLHPVGVVFDVSDRFVNPSSYGQTFQVTLWFFILLLSMYFVLRQMVKAIREER